MFAMKDLRRYYVMIDYTKQLPESQPKKSVSQLLQGVHLSILKTRSFSELNVAFSEIKDSIPVLVYSKGFGRYHARLGVFDNMKIELRLERADRFVLSESSDSKEKQDEELSIERLQEISTDLNFLVGNLRGVLDMKQAPDVSTSLAFRRNGKILPSEKLLPVNISIRSVLGDQKASMVGFKVESYENPEMKRSVSVTQYEKHYVFADDFQSKLSGPVDLVGTLQGSLKAMNGIHEKIVAGC